jgi:hypothetical protein
LIQKNNNMNDALLSSPLPTFDDLCDGVSELFERGFVLAGAAKGKLKTIVVGNQSETSPLCGQMSFGVVRVFGQSLAADNEGSGAFDPEDPNKLENDTKFGFKYFGALKPFQYKIGTNLSLTTGQIRHKIVLEEIAGLPGASLEAGAVIETKKAPSEDQMSFGITAGNSHPPLLSTVTGTLVKPQSAGVAPQLSAVFSYGHLHRGLLGLSAEWGGDQVLEVVRGMAGYVSGRDAAFLVGTAETEDGISFAKEARLTVTRNLSELLLTGFELTRGEGGSTDLGGVCQLENEGVGLLAKTRLGYSSEKGVSAKAYIQQRLWGGVTMGLALQKSNSFRWGISLSN